MNEDPKKMARVYAELREIAMRTNVTIVTAQQPRPLGPRRDEPHDPKAPIFIDYTTLR